MEKTKLTEKQREEYLAHGGNHCPFCGKQNGIESGYVESDSGEAWQSCYCEECEHSWTDLYTLTGVEGA